MPTPKFANLMEILERESDAETGVVSAGAEGRLEVEMRKTLIDFFARFFLWCRCGFRAKTAQGSEIRQWAIVKLLSLSVFIASFAFVIQMLSGYAHTLIQILR